MVRICIGTREIVGRLARLATFRVTHAGYVLWPLLACSASLAASADGFPRAWAKRATGALLAR